MAPARLLRIEPGSTGANSSMMPITGDQGFENNIWEDNMDSISVSGDFHSQLMLSEGL